MKKYFKHKLENLITVSKIVTIHDFEFEKNFKSAGESHDFWELVYAEKESLICSADGKIINLSQGEVLFHKPNEFHTLSANGKKAPNVFILSFVCKSDAINYFANKKIKLENNQARFIYYILEEGKKTFDIKFSNPNLKKMRLLQSPTLGGEQLIKNYLEIFLIDLLRTQTETESGDNEVFLYKKYGSGKLVDDIVKILNQNVYKTIDIESICQKISYSRTYIFRVFKKRTGKTIIQYYNELKIETAKQLLRENELSIKKLQSYYVFQRQIISQKLLQKS